MVIRFRKTSYPKRRLAEQSGASAPLLCLRVANSRHCTEWGSRNQRMHLVGMAALFPGRANGSSDVIVGLPCLDRGVCIGSSRHGRDLGVRTTGCSAAVHVVVRDRGSAWFPGK